jgi:hypothetical protein
MGNCLHKTILFESRVNNNDRSYRIGMFRNMKKSCLLVCVAACCLAATDGRFGDISDLVITNDSKFVSSDSADAIPDHYIVRFDDGMSDDEVGEKAAELALHSGGEVLWIYSNVFKGVALTGITKTNLDNVLTRDDIGSIEQVGGSPIRLGNIRRSI